MDHPAALTARDDLNTPAAAAHSAAQAASAHLITYQPKLLVPAAQPHTRQRYPADSRGTRLCADDPDMPHREVSVMRFDGRRSANLEIEDLSASIKIALDAATLRKLALQLLDAAHDIEQRPFPQQIGLAA